ncbi:hypothetical protein RHSIM_Rhsim02G0180300 [Rhododendron simsii]|uniref:Prp31 C-terminal domain-containing protein n=1 Tax=Rhododendron simsii TaxID=118357 RepID=A0A834HEP5_RHOSS|nr:hypothetical protein RHSIM_Rhsim02G0180300 [Rhododendron simsii]
MWQEPPPAKRPKPLLVPDCKPKKKRGGRRRLRRMKQRYAITDMRKMANRIQFGVAEETYLGDGLGEGYVCPFLELVEGCERGWKRERHAIRPSGPSLIWILIVPGRKMKRGNAKLACVRH